MDKAFFLHRWPGVREGLMKILAAFDPDDLKYQPVEGGWSVGRILLHISSAANFWLHSGILSAINFYRPGESTLDNYSTIEAVKIFLAEEHERTLALLRNFDVEDWEKHFSFPDGCAYSPAWIFWHVFGHEIHHRGELSLILGLLGKDGLDV